MKQDVQHRFDALVDRNGEHHLWTGAINPARGTGRMKVNGRQMTAHRLAWELAHGPLPASVKVLPCPDVPACVRVDHLRVDRTVEAGMANRPTSRRGHGRRGGGSMQQRRPGVWKLTVTTLPDQDGNTRRLHRTVSARTAREATEELARFVDEIRSMPVVVPKEDHRLCMDDAVERFLSEHLRDERGREEKTIRDYRALHHKWFAPELGRRLVRDVDRAAIGERDRKHVLASRCSSGTEDDLASFTKASKRAAASTVVSAAFARRAGADAVERIPLAATAPAVVLLHPSATSSMACLARRMA